MGEWVEKISNKITENTKARILMGEAFGEYIDFLNDLSNGEETITISEQEIKEWEQKVKDEYTEQGLVD